MAPANRSVRLWSVGFALLLLVASTTWFVLPSVPAGSLRSTISNFASTPGNSVVAPAFVPGPGVVRVGAVAPDQPLDVAVGLPLRDPAGLNSLVELQYAPGSPDFHQYLNASALAARFGPDRSVYSHAVDYFRAFGLSVTPSPDRLVLVVAGPSGRVAAAFHTGFAEFRSEGRTFFSHTTPATLPSSILWSGVVGLGNVSPPRPSVGPLVPLRSAPNVPAAGCASGSAPYSPCQIRAAYNLSGFVGTGVNGTGYRIGVVDTYDAQENQTTLIADFASFTSTYALPRGNVRYLYPVPTTRDLNVTYTGWGTEEALDLEWARAMAPGAGVDMTFAPDPTAGLYGSVDWLVAHQAVNVISLSWGEPDVGSWSGCAQPCNATSDGSYGMLHPVLEEAAAEGIGVFVASGDCGAADGTTGVATNYPASDPYAIGVGATNLTLNSTNAWLSETGWGGNASANNGGCFNQGGSGGGYSPFPKPWWQAAPGLAATDPVRAVPDVAADGGSGSPVDIVVNGFFGAASGTSASCPMWAGIAAIADDRAGSALGFLGPAVYSVARGASYGSAFHDVTRGSNGYRAGTGWDAVTGVGTPNARVLLPLLANSTVSRSNLSLELGASPRFGATPLTVNFHALASNGTGVYPLYSVDFGDGNSSATTNGSASHVYLHPGVFGAVAVVFDSAGNSSVSSAVAIVVGGGAGLTVRLNATPNSTAVGTSVNLTANVTGGVGPYRYSYLFGDGTYLANATHRWANHSYGSSGGYCAMVVVHDSHSPLDGGASAPVAVRIGGAGAPGCRVPTPLNVSVSSTVVAADVPGDFPVQVHLVGGSPPVHLQYVSDDPYVAACNCTIFRTPGNHTLTLYANDSVNQQAVARLNVTVYPQLSGQFQASALVGPLASGVTFRAAASGGHVADVNQTRWAFGDGASGTGANVLHTYSSPGTYFAEGVLSDNGHSNVSEGFLVDELAGSAGAFGIGATMSPVDNTGAGEIVNFTCSVVGATSPYTVYWQFDANDSAFGSSVQQTFTRAGGLPWNATNPVLLRVTFANGTVVHLAFQNSGSFQVDRWSGLTLTDTFAPTSGSTPFPFAATAQVQGLGGALVQWNFGDGNSSVGPVAQHTYFVPGNYTVTELATDPLGDRLVRTLAIPVAGVARVPPTVTIRVAPASGGVVPFPATFTANATGGSGAPYSFAWQLGDGGLANGSSVTHTYLTAGNFTVGVTAHDSVGDRASATANVSVYNVTSVELGLASPASTGVRGAPVALNIVVLPGCTGHSVPRCGSVAIPLQYSFVDLADPTGTTGWTPVVAPVTNGGWHGTVSANLPPLPGNYSIVLETTGTNYSGAAHFPFRVTGGPPPNCGGLVCVAGTGVTAGMLVVVSVAFVLLAGIYLLYRRRARRSPDPPEPDPPRAV